MRKWKVLGLFLASGSAGSVLAQPVNVPTAFMWAPAIPSAWPAGLTGITPMVHIDTNYALPDETGNPITDPTAAGIFAAHRAAALATASGSAGTFKVCILIKDFGKGGDQNSSLSLNQRNFFDPADDLQPIAGSFNWPHPTILDSNNIPQPDPTAKPNLHPFLINANSGPANITRRPLHDWMQQFVAGYVSVAGAPKPSAFYFDNEVVLASPVGQNPIYLLEELAKMPYYWSQIPVPGQVHPVTGLPVTLQELYGIQVTACGWLADIGDQISSASNAIDLAKNREVMSWWYGICQQARNAVLNYSAYGVIHSIPTWVDVKCGNYDDLNADGAMDATGWFTDRKSTGVQATDNLDYVPRPPALNRAWNMLPRADAERSHGGALYFLNNNRRYWGLSKKASGESDCPVLYELQDLELNGDGYRPGFQQINVYSGLLESPWETAVRLSRHSVESSINSNGGMHNNRLAPWVQMPYTTFLADGNETAPNAGYRTQAQIATMVAMLRAKNVPEIQFFTDDAAYLTENTPEAWLETSDVLRQVYGTRVDAYSILPPQLNPPPVAPAKLEYTLRNSAGTLDTVDILGSFAAYNPTEYLPQPKAQELVVDFKWVPGPGDGLLGRPAFLLDNRMNSLRMNIEYATNRIDTLGEVFVWRRNDPPTVPSEWVRARVVNTHAANFVCRSATLAGLYSNRVTLSVETHDRSDRPPDSIVWYDSQAAVWKTRIKIRQTNLVASALTTKFDLVQLYPDYLPPVLQEDVFAAADLNMDGVVDANDLVAFMDAWVDEAPPADLDMNGSVDFDDLDTFVNALG